MRRAVRRRLDVGMAQTSEKPPRAAAAVPDAIVLYKKSGLPQMNMHICESRNNERIRQIKNRIKASAKYPVQHRTQRRRQWPGRENETAVIEYPAVPKQYFHRPSPFRADWGKPLSYISTVFAHLSSPVDRIVFLHKLCFENLIFFSHPTSCGTAAQNRFTSATVVLPSAMEAGLPPA